jgi:PAS domain S-box-containing protein/putative nucleotidyltransferase with HDIG domain
MVKSELGQVLIFGDNAEFITSLCDILAKSGYQAFSCTMWENALEALKAHDFDLFLIDVSMPDMDGIALLRGAMTLNAHLMSIIITDQKTIQSSIKTMGINVFDYILKPFNVEELMTKISKAIEVGRLRKTGEMYRSIFENAVEGIYLMTNEERYLTANHALAQILGYESPDELITDLNKTENQLYVQPDHRPKVLSLTQKIDVISGLESQVFRRDGSKVWISENVRAVRDIDGHLLYYRGTVEDISKKKQAMEELFETETHLRQCAENAEKNKEIFLDIIDDVHDSYKQLENLFINFVKAIVNTCEERRPWNKGHSQRVASYSLKIAKGMGLSNDEKEKLRLAALLHDIGQILYDKLADKPEKLTNEEFEVIKKHPLLGVTILQKVKQLKDIIPIIRHHHERIDGKGYPDGLKGEEIPVCARILHVADSFESMTADRPYRAAQGKEYAYLELKRCNNTQFDPKIAEVALKVL